MSAFHKYLFVSIEKMLLSFTLNGSCSGWLLSPFIAPGTSSRLLTPVLQITVSTSSRLLISVLQITVSTSSRLLISVLQITVSTSSRLLISVLQINNSCIILFTILLTNLRYIIFDSMGIYPITWISYRFKTRRY